MPPPGKGLTQRFSSASVEPQAHEHRIHLMNLNGSIPPSALSRFHVKPAHSHRKTLTMPHTPVRRCTLWLSDSLCFSDTRNSINASQSRCICHALPPQQYAFHPIGRHVLNGRPPASTQQRHPVGPHVLQHMPCLPPGKKNPARPIRQLGVTVSVLGSVCGISGNISVGRAAVGFT